MMTSKTILLVHDDSDSIERLRPRLEIAGYTVVDAGDAATAMALLNKSEIGLVVTELYLPTGTQRCLVRAIREAKHLRRTRVIAYTTHGRQEDRDWARSCRAEGYVITRSGEERLLSVVDSLMAKPPRKRVRKSAVDAAAKGMEAAND
jgi:CheY-like chemotaxis protein